MIPCRLLILGAAHSTGREIVFSSLLRPDRPSYMCCNHLADVTAIPTTHVLRTAYCAIDCTTKCSGIEQLPHMVTLPFSRRPVTIELRLILGHIHTYTLPQANSSVLSDHLLNRSEQLSYTGYVNGCADIRRFKLCICLKIGNAPHLNLT